MAACIGTWIFGLHAVKSAKKHLLEGNSALDSVEKGLSDAEEDISIGGYLVGRGGLPNSEGIMECDAAIMDGETSRFGAVIALQGVSSPIRVARKVMDESNHNILVGSGAQAFAKRHGFAIENNDDLMGEESSQKYLQFKNKQEKPSGHDTLGLITRDKQGRIAVAVTTSGMPFKEPGRVGDSPLPGPGLYVDKRFGAACATGDGDDILKFSPCSRIVMMMGSGMHPKEACEKVVGDIMQVWKGIVGENGRMLEIGVAAMSVSGEVGAASSIKEWEDYKTGKCYPGFTVSKWSEEKIPQETNEVVSAAL